MKKITLFALATLLVTGAAFASGKKKHCTKDCCKDKKECCKDSKAKTKDAKVKEAPKA